MGEFYGSRLSSELRDLLGEKGASRVAGELHTITGSSPDNAILLRGIELDKYQSTEEYQILEGRPLLPGDIPRLAMVGVKLAEQKNAFPGETIEIRGRDFRVVGVFGNGTFADYEAWISLEDAQTLMGYGGDVSIYLIPAGEQFAAGDQLPGGIAIVQKGDSGQTLINEWRPFFRLFRKIIAILGISATVVLTNIIWRLTWLRKRDLAILQSIGFKRHSLLAYLAIQASGITAAGVSIGITGALAIGAVFQLRTAGITITAVFNLMVIAIGIAFAFLMALTGTLISAYWFSRQNLVQFMKADE